MRQINQGNQGEVPSVVKRSLRGKTRDLLTNQAMKREVLMENMVLKLMLKLRKYPLLGKYLLLNRIG
jgi:hypothetical protein